MKFPLVVSSGNSLIIAPPDFFDRIGKLDLEEGTLEISVKASGKSELGWMLDAEGVFFDLSLIGLSPQSMMQKIGLRRRREKFTIMAGKKISVGELGERIHGMVDRFPEAPFVSDLRALLVSLPQDHLLGRDDLFAYLGE